MAVTRGRGAAVLDRCNRAHSSVECGLGRVGRACLGVRIRFCREKYATCQKRRRWWAAGVVRPWVCAESGGDPAGCGSWR